MTNAEAQSRNDEAAASNFILVAPNTVQHRAGWAVTFQRHGVQYREGDSVAAVEREDEVNATRIYSPTLRWTDGQPLVDQSREMIVRRIREAARFAAWPTVFDDEEFGA